MIVNSSIWLPRFKYRLIVVMMSVPLLSGCAATFPARFEAKPMLFAPAPATVFVADGAGNFQMATKSLRAVLKKDGYPIEVVTYEWSHGHRRVIADQVGYHHACAEGKKLAETVVAYRAAHPKRPIYLLGHSAGSMVTLSALEALPPNVVERAILLSPSLSRDYDLRPALHSVKRSVNVFYSPDDYFYLGMVTGVLGTADRRWIANAGRTGFRVQPGSDDPELLSKLVQRPWQTADRELGNDGGHYGNYQPDFLRVRVISLFDPSLSSNR